MMRVSCKFLKAHPSMPTKKSSEIRQVARGSSVVASHSRSPTFHLYAHCYRPTGPRHSARGGGFSWTNSTTPCRKETSLRRHHSWWIYHNMYECGFAIENIMIWRNLYSMLSQVPVSPSRGRDHEESWKCAFSGSLQIERIMKTNISACLHFFSESCGQ